MLEQIITLLKLENPSDEVTSLLNTIIDITSQRLQLMLNAKEVPGALQFIVTEVSIIRFNRIGSEGVNTHTVQGEHMSWWSDDDFKAYRNDITAWLDAQDDPTTTRGRLTFL